MREVAHPAQQPAGDARGATRAAGDLVCPGRVDGDAEQPRAAGDHQLELRHLVEVEPHRDAEAVAQRGGQQALAGGRADQRERRQVDPHRARRGPLADDQVERAVLHRRVEHLPRPPD
jgi:hypothetical protein